jgi:hypothetical protein
MSNAKNLSQRSAGGHDGSNCGLASRAGIRVLSRRGHTAREQAKRSDAGMLPIWAYKTFVAVVTVNVLMVVLDHWRSYGVVSKFLAIVLLDWLVLMPIAATQRWRTSTFRFEWPDLWITYMVLTYGHHAVRQADVGNFLFHPMSPRTADLVSARRAYLPNSSIA